MVSRRGTILAGLAGWCALAALPAWAGGHCEPEWLPGDGFAGIDGEVYATTTWDPDGPGHQRERLVLGGNFVVAGAGVANHIVAWDGNRWYSFGEGIGGPIHDELYVSALAVYQGDLIAGGKFLEAGGETVNYIARWDGAAWQPMGTGLNREVQALIVYEGHLIAGGEFWTVGVGEPGIARWNGSAWESFHAGLDLTFQDVEAFTIKDGDLIAGGKIFLETGEEAGVIRWNGTNWQAVGDTDANGRVLALTTYQGELIAGGEFTEIGQVSAKRVAAWDGVSWRALGPGTDNQVEALTVFGGKLIAGSEFTSIGGEVIEGVAAWEGAMWESLGSGVTDTAEDPAAFALQVYHGDLFVAGRIDYAGGVRVNNLGRWTGTEWQAVEAGTDRWVMSLAIHEGRLIAGGEFTRIGGVEANRVASYDGRNWRPLGAGLEGAVRVLLAYDGYLVAGAGDLGGGPAHSLARWDGTDWYPMGDPFDAPVLALAEYNGELVAGGAFTMSGGIVLNHIARWDGAAWRPLGGGMDGGVQALGIYAGELIAAGGFSTAGGVAASAVASWNGTNWKPLGAGLTETGPGQAGGRALGAFEGELIVGGSFTHAGGVPANNVARWNGNEWLAMGGGFGFDTNAVAVYHGELIAAGVGGLSEPDAILSWDGTDWHPLGTGIQERILALTVYDDQLVAGGTFLMAGGGVSAYWARWGCPPIHQPCPLEELAARSPDGPDMLGTLRSFRDQVLSKTRTGRRYVDLYYHHAGEVRDLIRENWRLRYKAAALLFDLTPIIRRSLDGQRIDMTPAQVGRVDDFLQELENTASPELARVVRTLRTELAAESLPGMENEVKALRLRRQ